MNIKEAIEQGVTTLSALTEPYILKITGYGNVEYVKPVDVDIRNIRFPLTPDDVDFTYQSSVENQRRNLGQFKFDTFFPIGHTLSLMGVNATITSYSEPIRNTFGNNLYYLSAEATFDVPLETARVNNDALEYSVLNAFNTIIAANESVKQSLINYDHNIIDMASNTALDIQSGVSLINSLRTQEKDIDSAHHTLFSLDVTSSDQQTLMLDATEYKKYYEARDLSISYKGNQYSMNSQAFLSFICDDDVIEDDSIAWKKLCLQTHTGHNFYIKPTVYVNGNISIVIYTPSYVTYNIVILLKDPTRTDRHVISTSAYGVLRVNKLVPSGNNAMTFKYNTDDNSAYANISDIFADICDENAFANNSTAEANYFNVTLYNRLDFAGVEDEFEGVYVKSPASEIPGGVPAFGTLTVTDSGNVVTTIEI